MSYKGPTKFKLLVLITKYNLAYPTDKIKPQITETVNERDSHIVGEYIAQETTLRAQYPYNSFQKQAQKLQPLLKQVLELTNFASYEQLNWMELLVGVNDMLKQVRSKMEECDKIRNERQKKELERRRTQHAFEKLQKAKEEQKRVKKEKKRAERENQVEKAAEQAKANLPQNDPRPNKLQKKPNALVYPIEAMNLNGEKTKVPDKSPAAPVSPKAPLIENPEKTSQVPANLAPPLPPRCPYPMGNVTEGYIPMYVLEPKTQPVPGFFPESTPPALPPRKDSPSENPAKPTTPPTRPALQTRTRSKDEPKKKVSFDGIEAERPKHEDTIMTGMDTPVVPGAWKDESIDVLSVIPPEQVLPEEKTPRRKKGREPEHHQAKMDKAHYEALRVAPEINKFSWPGEARK